MSTLASSYFTFDSRRRRKLKNRRARKHDIKVVFIPLEDRLVEALNEARTLNEIRYLGWVAELLGSIPSLPLVPK